MVLIALFQSMFGRTFLSEALFCVFIAKHKHDDSSSSNSSAPVQQSVKPGNEERGLRSSYTLHSLSRSGKTRIMGGFQMLRETLACLEMSCCHASMTASKRGQVLTPVS